MAGLAQKGYHFPIRHQNGTREQNRTYTKVVDRGYFARINNNKVKIPLFAEFSKNNSHNALSG